MEIKIIEPIKNYSKVFNTPEEFNSFYTKNKNEMNLMTTHKLNKMYFIEGYRITKIKGVLMLKKWDDKDKNENEDELNEFKNNLKNKDIEINSIKDGLSYYQNKLKEVKEEINSIKDKLNEFKEEMKKELKQIKETINSIITVLNGEQ